MANGTPVRKLLNGRFAFFQEFLRHPLEIGSVVPSSRYLERRVLDAAAIETASTVIELGCGTGGTTRAILRAMAPNARLLSIDVNPHFHAMVSAIDDDRLIAHLGNARDLPDILSHYDLEPPEAVISGIPFSTMNREVGAEICEIIADLLVPNGRFVAYQVSDRVAALCRPLFGTERVALEFRNVPPMRVFHWQKAN
jgi:phospholipid N-methyltransferase